MSKITDTTNGVTAEWNSGTTGKAKVIGGAAGTALAADLAVNGVSSLNDAGAAVNADYAQLVKDTAKLDYAQGAHWQWNNLLNWGTTDSNPQSKIDGLQKAVNADNVKLAADQAKLNGPGNEAQTFVTGAIHQVGQQAHDAADAVSNAAHGNPVAATIAALLALGAGVLATVHKMTKGRSH